MSKETLILRAGQGSTRYNCYIDRVDSPEESKGRLLVTDLGCHEAQEYCRTEEEKWGEEFTVWMERMS
jgi:hypothetical protein